MSIIYIPLEEKSAVMDSDIHLSPKIKKVSLWSGAVKLVLVNEMCALHVSVVRQVSPGKLKRNPQSEGLRQALPLHLLHRGK